MSIEIPYDLIKQVQNAVLIETNFSSYDPDDVSFPDLPSFESSISELDPSPPHLRCKNCKGRLLRGVNSLICVFCGKQRAPQEAPPEPINFKSTFGCRWLLDSLGLDGSETAALPVQENESNRGQNATQKEFPLSDLLDLEITWNSEFDKLGTESNQSSFNFAGVNPDNFLAERKRAGTSAVSVEQSQLINNDNGSGNDDFQVRDNVHLFENVQSSETAVRTIEVESGTESLGGWEANFQSAGTGTSHEESKSVDPVVGSSVDLSGQMDEVLGYGKIFGKDKEEILSSGSRSNDWFQDDQFSSSRSSTSGQSKQVEVTGNEKDGRPMQNANNSSSMGIDGVQDGQWNTESKKTQENKTVHELDDSFDTWNDFASSTTAEHLPDKQSAEATQLEKNAIVKDGGKVEYTNSSSSRNVNWLLDDLPHTISTEKQDNKAIVEEIDASDDWNDFASSTTVQDPYSGQTGPKQFEMIDNAKDGKKAENANSSSSLNVDWFQDFERQTNNNKGTDNNTIDASAGFFDAWSDFTSSTSAQDPSEKQTGKANLFGVTTDVKDGGKVETSNNSTNIALIQDDQWLTTGNKKHDSKATDEGDDLFDTWNDFTSSATAQDSTNKHTGQAKDFEVNTNVKDHGIMDVSNSSFDWLQGDQLQTSSNKAPDGKITDEDPDSFDAWNDFTSSISAQDPSNNQPVNHVTSSAEQTSEIKSSATKNLQNVDFGSFLEPDIFLGASHNQNGSFEVNIMKSEPSVSNRISDVKAEDGVNAGDSAKGDILSATKRSTEDLETLMSQMHDLSFMLASDLSIPPKQR